MQQLANDQDFLSEGYAKLQNQVDELVAKIPPRTEEAKLKELFKSGKEKDKAILALLPDIDSDAYINYKEEYLRIFFEADKKLYDLKKAGARAKEREQSFKTFEDKIRAEYEKAKSKAPKKAKLKATVGSRFKNLQKIGDDNTVEIIRNRIQQLQTDVTIAQIDYERFLRYPSSTAEKEG